MFNVKTAGRIAIKRSKGVLGKYANEDTLRWGRVLLFSIVNPMNMMLMFYFSYILDLWKRKGGSLFIPVEMMPVYLASTYLVSLAWLSLVYFFKKKKGYSLQMVVDSSNRAQLVFIVFSPYVYFMCTAIDGDFLAFILIPSFVLLFLVTGLIAVWIFDRALEKSLVRTHISNETNRRVVIVSTLIIIIVISAYLFLRI